eukprot:495698_1
MGSRIVTSSTVDYTTDSIDDGACVGKFAVSYDMHDDDWSEYIRMFNSNEWKGDLPTSFHFDKTNTLHQLIIEIKQQTKNRPSSIRNKQDLINALKNTKFLNKNQEFIMKNLDMTIEDIENIICIKETKLPNNKQIIKDHSSSSSSSSEMAKKIKQKSERKKNRLPFCCFKLQKEC